MTLVIATLIIEAMELQAWLKIPGNTQTKLAEVMSKIGRPVTQGAISHWLRPGGKVPAERVPQIVKATKGEVTEADLRPDLFKRRGRAA